MQSKSVCSYLSVAISLLRTHICANRRAMISILKILALRLVESGGIIQRVTKCSGWIAGTVEVLMPGPSIFNANSDCVSDAPPAQFWE